MKYFTKEIWLGLQNEKKRIYYEKIFKKNDRLYEKNINKLKSKLSTHAFSFFSLHHRQGDYILNISIINGGTIYVDKATNEAHLINKSSRLIDLNVITLCPTRKFCVLQYKKVRKYVLDYPSESPLWFEGEGGHGTWGYDELSYIQKGGFLKHEILLHSGAIIIIEFKEFNYKCIKIKNNLRGKNQKWESVFKRLKGTDNDIYL